MRTVGCFTCSREFPVTEDHWFPSIVKMLENKPTRVSYGKCRACAIEYGNKWRQDKKDRGLTRKGNIANKGVWGKAYVVVPVDYTDQVEFYAKIGITSGTQLRKRLAGIQTGNPIELKVALESTPVDDVRGVETILHNMFSKKYVRGEWFKINHADLSVLKTVLSEIK